MQNSQTVEAPALTEADELYWRIYAPMTRRLHCWVTWQNHETRIVGAPYSPGSPRLWLMDMSDGFGPDEDMLWIKVESHERVEALCKAAREAVYFAEGFARPGTWRRYFQALAYVKHIVAGTGWTLTGEEQDLIAALEVKGSECPAWVGESIGQVSSD